MRAMYVRKKSINFVILQRDEDGNDHNGFFSVDSDSDDIDISNSFQRSRARSNFVNVGAKDSIPLLNVGDDDDSSSDDEQLRASANSRVDGHRAKRQVDDNFYLSDQRRWTGVRDAHLSAVNEK